jgi:Kef-type K+ transport system membrane component KefB
VPFFVELSIILAFTTGIAILTRALHQPLAVGYILSGIVVGPYVLNILHSTEAIDVFSKIGIAVLLFIVGLSLNPDTIKETGRAAVITGLGQILFTSVIGYALIIALGFDHLTALYGSIALTFSSTIIILKLLSDKGDLGKLYGKISIGFLLVQDLVATLLLVIVPIIGLQALGGEGVGATLADLLLKGVGATVVLYAISKFALPHLSYFLARSQELLFLFSIAWGLGLASLFAYLGFSIEIGALIAGVTLSVSSYAFEISSRMRPLRDFFIVLFFVLLGSHVQLSDVTTFAWPAIVLSLFVLIGNPLIVFALMNFMGYRSRTGFLAGLTVAQISEFSLILMALGLSLGHVNTQAVSLITFVGLITIAGSTYLIMYGDRLYVLLKPVLRLLEFRRPHRREHALHTSHEMIIFGYGQIGSEFVKTAEELGTKYLVVDYNPEIIARMREEKMPIEFGDAEDVEFLDEIQLKKARLVVSTIPDPNVNHLLVKHYRSHNNEGIIVVLSHNRAEAKSLYLAGASYVIMPHLLGAKKASSMITRHEDNVEVFEKARNAHLSELGAVE